jgi:acyl-CoA dehydrogenase
VLSAECTPQVVREAEAGRSDGALWRHLEEAGFVDALVPEANDGAGLCLADVFPVFELCGAHAVPVPLAETMICRALMAEGGMTLPTGSIVIAQTTSEPGDDMVCPSVSSGAVTDRVLVAAHGKWLLLDAADADASPAGFALDATLRWSAKFVAAAQRMTCARDAMTLQACIHAAKLSGALQHVLEVSLRYANERQQFGRPIGKFQAIQHQLAMMAEQVFAARMAAQIGCLSHTPMPARLRVAVAKARTSEAALEVADLSHSIHGAIGFTVEYDLQIYTRRLHAWRQAGGSESYWQRIAGQDLVDGAACRAVDWIRRNTEPGAPELDSVELR